MGQILEKYMNDRIFQPPTPYMLSMESFNSNDLNIELLETSTKNSFKVSFVKITPKNYFEKYIVFSHGNGCDISQMLKYGKYLCYTFNVCVIIYDYLGYGLSDSQPSEQGCYDSIEAVMDYIFSVLDVVPKNIILIGHSLGTGVVLDYVYKKNWTFPLILISPYKSIVTVVADSAFAKPIDKFVSIDKIKYINAPIKIYHGEEDKLINVSHGKKLYELIKNKKFKPTWIPKTDHNNILDKLTKRIYLDEIKYIINFE